MEKLDRHTLALVIEVGLGSDAFISVSGVIPTQAAAFGCSCFVIYSFCRLQDIRKGPIRVLKHGTRGTTLMVRVLRMTSLPFQKRGRAGMEVTDFGLLRDFQMIPLHLPLSHWVL